MTFEFRGKLDSYNVGAPRCSSDTVVTNVTNMPVRRWSSRISVSGTFDRPAFAVWLIAFLYSGASLFYVRLLTRSTIQQRGKRVEESSKGIARWLVIYLVSIALLLALLIPLGWLPPLAGLAFAPLLVKIVWVHWRSNYRPTLKELGIAEVGHAVVFAALAAFALASWMQ